MHFKLRVSQSEFISQIQTPKQTECVAFTKAFTLTLPKNTEVTLDANQTHTVNIKSLYFALHYISHYRLVWPLRRSI